MRLLSSNPTASLAFIGAGNFVPDVFAFLLKRTIFERFFFNISFHLISIMSIDFVSKVVQNSASSLCLKLKLSFCQTFNFFRLILS